MHNKISHFRILEELGRGGMGVVYKALDTRLQRHVAIKILPSDFIVKESNLLRFIREARAASALNHPNICTVYDIGNAQGVHFIVMEYIDGETLREIIAHRGPLLEKEVVDIGIKVCDALLAAHAKGIIHRDIKPDNIMISREGYVKVMDFGLAKLMNGQYELIYESEEESFLYSNDKSRLLKTSISTLQGTALYMSPEQIKKEPIDQRTDIYSLGIVLYELLTGTHPFSGFDRIAVMQSIISDNPKPPSQLRSHISQLMDMTLLKALAKSPAERHKSVSFLRSDIQKSISVNSKQYSRLVISLISSIIGIIFLTLLILSVKAWFSTEKKNSPPLSLKMYPIGLTSEIESNPAFSPDEKKIIYTSKKAGVPGAPNNCWIKNLETGVTKLFASYSGVTPDWSPDGRRIAFSCPGIFITDSTGKNIKKVVEFGYNPKWSPNGKQIVFSTNSEFHIGTKKDLYLFCLKDSSLQQISPKNGLQYASPEWSPDSRWIVCTRGEGSRWELWLINSITDDAKLLYKHGAWISNPVWCPSGNVIYFSSNKNGPRDVWRVSVDIKNGIVTDKPVQITTGLDILTMDISPIHGDRLVFSRVKAEEKIWRVPLPKDSEDTWHNAQILATHTNDTQEIEVSPDGTKLVLETLPGSIRCLTILSMSDNSEFVLYRQQPAFAPSWSPDGKWIAFDAGGGNEADIWRIPASGGHAEKIIENPGADWLPTFSPEGQHICFLSNRSGNFDLWVKNLDTKEITQITDSPESESRGFWSHSGGKIAFLRFSSRKNCHEIWIYDFERKTGEKISHFPNKYTYALQKIFWRSDDNALYYYYIGQLKELTIKNRKIKTIIKYNDENYLSRILTISGNFFYFVTKNIIEDIWIAEGLN